MMLYKKSHFKTNLLSSLIFFFLTVLQSSGVMPLKIGQASPLYILGLLVAFSVFSTAKAAAVAGFLVGAVLDSTAAEGYCFNTIALTVIGVAVYLFANNLYNKNIFAALVMSFLAAFFYFGLNWLIFNAFDISLTDGISYLFTFTLPSAIYTAVFVIPFFFIYKRLEE